MKKAKTYIQEMTSSKETVFLSFDDCIQEKKYTDESELICWLYDHVSGKSVKGVNFLNALVEVSGIQFPVVLSLLRRNFGWLIKNR